MAVLRSLDLVGSAREPVFDALVEAASAALDTPIALITLLDERRQWFKAKVGLDRCETPRDTAFCHYTVLSDEVLWIRDAREDVRFARNPLVLGEPHIRFYAGAPITVEGQRIGALCVIDREPRDHSPQAEKALRSLAACVVEQIVRRAGNRGALHLVESTGDAAVCFNSSGQITFWNKGAEDLLGYSRAEIVGRNADLVFPASLPAGSDPRDVYRERMAHNSAQAYEAKARHKDGRELDFEISASFWQDGETYGAGAILRDCTERKLFEAALAAAKLEAEAASIAKSEFLANMSHEIRTPLNGVISMADLLARSALNPHDRKLVQIIRSSGDSLNRLLSDILDLARIESGVVELEESPFHFGEAVRGAVALCALQAQEKGILLSVDVAPDADQHFRGDEVRIRQIVINLVSNAVKFTSVGEVRVLAAAPQSGGVAIEVSDTGVGFDPEIGERLFERFQQADGSITRRFGGTGLGLPISRQLAEAMGGSLNCQSTPGKGSSFWFEAPLAPACPSRTRIVDVDALAAPGGRVLVVDDHPTNRAVAELILTDFGFEVEMAEDGRQALAALEGRRFDLVLMDMQMPVMDGLTAVRRIRGLEATGVQPRTPILMLTANALPEHVDQSKAAGADGHLAKPITAPVLMRAIVEVVQAQAGSVAGREALTAS